MVSQFVNRGKKIIGIGRNYLDHIKELKNEVPVKPFFFLKPTSSYITKGQKIEIPFGITCHHEVELGVIIGKKCKSISMENSMKYVSGYTIAIDLTARNLQEDVRRNQLPWSSSKGFDTFCPVGKFIQAQEIINPDDLTIWLKVNGKIKQHGTTKDMIFKIPELISHCSGIMTLEEGDLILTGTPSGVSSILPGDLIEIGLEEKTNKNNFKLIDKVNFDVIQRIDGLNYDQLKI